MGKIIAALLVMTAMTVSSEVWATGGGGNGKDGPVGAPSNSSGGGCGRVVIEGAGGNGYNTLAPALGGADGT